MPWVLIIIINFMWLCKCIFNCAKFCQVHGDAFRYTLSKLLFLDMHRLTVPFLIIISDCFKLMHTVELLLRFSSWTCTFLWILCTHKPIIIANKWKHHSLDKYSTWWICQQSQTISSKHLTSSSVLESHAVTSNVSSVILLYFLFM